MALRAGAFYDFPQSFGLQLALDRPFQVRSGTVIRCDGRIRHKRSVWRAGGEMGAYRYAFNHSGVWLTGTMARQTGWDGRFALEMRLGQGVLRTFYDGKVYIADQRGKVVERPLGGRWYALTQLAIQPGRRLRAAGNTRLFIEPALWSPPDER